LQDFFDGIVFLSIGVNRLEDGLAGNELPYHRNRFPGRDWRKSETGRHLNLSSSGFAVEAMLPTFLRCIIKIDRLDRK
jgi:hypothetical protein